jgi:hypothetical protein
MNPPNSQKTYDENKPNHGRSAAIAIFQVRGHTPERGNSEARRSYLESLTTRMIKLRIGEGWGTKGMSDPTSQLISQEDQDVMG